MNLLQLVLKQMRQRALSTWLTLLAVVLGSALAIAVLILRRESGNLFVQTDFGYDVIVGAKGSPMQLVLNTVYHVDQSPGNIPYVLYEGLRNNPSMVKHAVPYVVGDTYKGYRVAGTTPALFGFDEKGRPLAGYDDQGRLKPGVLLPPKDDSDRDLSRQYAASTFEYRLGRKFSLAQGRMFHPLKFEAVIGAEVAERAGLKLGDQFKVQHDLGANAREVDEHDEKWTVVGVLDPTRTAEDRVLFIPLVSFYAIPQHEDSLEKMAEFKQRMGLMPPSPPPAPAKKDEEDHHDHKHDHKKPATTTAAPAATKPHKHDHGDHDHGDEKPATPAAPAATPAKADPHDHAHDGHGHKPATTKPTTSPAAKPDAHKHDDHGHDHKPVDPKTDKKKALADFLAADDHKHDHGDHKHEHKPATTAATTRPTTAPAGGHDHDHDHDRGHAHATKPSTTAPATTQSAAAKPKDDHDGHDHEHDHAYHLNPDGTIDLHLSMDKWQLSAVLVRARSGFAAISMQDGFRRGDVAMAVNPASQMRNFFNTFLSPGTQLLMVLALLVIVTAAVSILVSIYNAVAARSREIAIMRALGATRGKVLTLICTEAGLIGLIGGAIGMLVGHSLGAVVSAYFNKKMGTTINYVATSPEEWLYLIGVTVLAVIAGLVPGFKAYRTPVATNLTAV